MAIPSRCQSCSTILQQTPPDQGLLLAAVLQFVLPIVFGLLGIGMTQVYGLGFAIAAAIVGIGLGLLMARILAVYWMPH